VPACWDTAVVAARPDIGSLRHERGRESHVGDTFRSDAVQEMEDCWPSSVGPRGQALNHPVLRWLKTVVVSDREKAHFDASGGDQEDVPEASGRGHPAGRRC